MTVDIIEAIGRHIIAPLVFLAVAYLAFKVMK